MTPQPYLEFGASTEGWLVEIHVCHLRETQPVCNVLGRQQQYMHGRVGSEFYSTSKDRTLENVGRCSSAE